MPMPMPMPNAAIDMGMRHKPGLAPEQSKERSMLNPRYAVLDVLRRAEAVRLAGASGRTEYELMEHAGTAVATEIDLRWSIRPVTVLCGPGQNGGDGFVAARQLSEAGWPVRLALLGTYELLTGDTRLHAQRWDGVCEALELQVLDDAELVIDALFGAGLDRPLGAQEQAMLQAVAQRDIPLIAIDIPSGLVADTGESWGAVAATLTVTCIRKLPAHLLQPGRALCGEVVVAANELPDLISTQVLPETFENDPDLWLAELPRPTITDHKYSRGQALISGGYPRTGAARLAAHGAARIGAGIITIAVPDFAMSIYATELTGILVEPLETEVDFEKLLLPGRSTAMLIGPGAGVTSVTRARVVAMLKTGLPTVLDADALTIFRNAPHELFSCIQGTCILTPHQGEFDRLFPGVGDKLTRGRDASRRSGAIIVLKGSDTVIAAPDGRAIINANAPPSLATAGTGDVLAGIILGLLAQGMDPFLAAAAGVWLHGAAAAHFGPGLVAGDLPGLLLGVLHQLRERNSAVVANEMNKVLVLARGYRA